MIVALATPRVATSLDDGLARIDRLAGEAAAAGAEIVCFPEAYLPGLRGAGLDVLPFEPADAERVTRAVAEIARARRIAVIHGTELLGEGGRRVAAVVLDARGGLLGVQTKNQIAPSEDEHYVPGEGRRLFELNGEPFGVVLCHEGWRYPETVRWAAARGARVVFHPHHTGSDHAGEPRTQWGGEGPYYERALQLRALENAIWIASANYALRFQESATCIVDPGGRCHAALPYGEEGVLVRELDLERATRVHARRWAPERHRDVAEREPV